MTTRQNIIITGASSGLGAEMARQFAAKGRNLGLCARRVENLESLKKELEANNSGITVSIKALDVCDYEKVFTVFDEFKAEFGQIDRVIVNAGMGKGQPVGTGYFWANRETAETNFVAALAQCESAMQIFREQKNGHLVMISSMSAFRGQRRNLNTYAATKAGVAALAEGIRADMLNKPINVTTIYPGFIKSEINEKVKNTPFMVETKPGVAAMVKAIEKEVDEASVPSWPWKPLGWAMRNLPLKLVSKLG